MVSEEGGAVERVTRAETHAFAGVGGENTLGGMTRSSGLAWNAPIFYVYVFNQPFSDSELLSLQHDPYQIFKPRVPALYYTAAAAGGPLDNDRISAMLLMRPWEPTPMGA